ncbi:MAG TPA: ABC transporter ATP-binding protein [Candidatus Egerieousia sp.]|nr:ABC transporter ATP-binding protein [Candidatus Egerieousia sp.]HPT06068.1 ABC transporter ATP-binding protein [Candidatus Egerieousia sp.]
MKSFKRLLNYARPFKKFWPGYLILSIFSVIFGVANYALVDPLLKVLFEPKTVAVSAAASAGEIAKFSFSVQYFKDVFQYYLDKIFLQNGPLNALMFVCIILIIASLFSNVTRYWSQVILVKMRARIMKNIRTDLFSKITSLHVGYFHSHQKGDVLSRISNDVTEVQNGVANSFHILFREPLLIIGFLAGLFYMSPKLTIVTLLTIPFSAIVIGRIAHKLRKKAVTTQMLMGRIVSHFEEAMSGIRIIKAFNGRKYVQGNFEITNVAHQKNSRRMSYRQELASPISEFLGISIAAAVLFYGGWLQIHGELGMDMPAFVVYIAFYWRVLEPAKNISNAYASIERGMVSGDRLFAVLDVENPIKEKKNAVKLKTFAEEIEYKNVDFSYDRVPVLKNINVVIPKGKMVAIVGPSGAGKSTFADMLPRFYDVTGGEVLIDGVNIKDATLESLVDQMGIVTQDSILFNDSIYNNITFGAENVSDEDVVNAAKIANAYDFIQQMPDKFQTNIGDRGSNLSGGQRQRIAIARAILKNPPILILDEATSSLDTESERLVQDALGKLMKNRTSIVIAHRLSTIRYADIIIVIKDGEINEKGTHDQLVDKGGIYSHLCQLQDFA